MALPYMRNNYRSDAKSWKNEQIFTVANFAGGLNNVEPDNIIGDNESTDCRNMRFLDDVIMEKRPGIGVYDESNYPQISGSITWVDIYRPSLQDPLIVRGTDTELYIGDEKIADVEGTVRGVTYINKYYFVDGKSLRVYDIDKKKCYKIVQEPIVHLTEAIKSGDVLKVDEIPEITKVGDSVMLLGASIGKEANFTTTIKSIDVENKAITLETSLSTTTEAPVGSPVFLYIPLDETNVVGEEIFNDETGIAYYKPCILEISDTYAGESYFPDSPNIITVHNSRLFVAGDSKQPHGVYMSKTAQPLYFPSAAGITVKPDGDEIVDLVVFDNALIIGRHNDMYVLYGSSEYQELSDDPYYIKQMDVSCGFMCSRCGALLNNYYIYLGYDGRFYKLNTPTTFVEYLMTAPLPHKCDIYSAPLNIATNTQVKVNAVPYRNEIYFCINDDFVIVYNYDNMAYTYYVGWDAWSLSVFNNKLLIGRSDGQLVYFRDDEESFMDLDEPIDCTYETKRYEIYNPLTFKFFKQLLTSSHASDNSLSNILVDIFVDYTSMRLPEAISSNRSRFDSASWNVNRFDSPSLYKSSYYQLNIRGRSIKFKMSNATANEGMRVYDLNVLYTLRDVR